jgi:hypothetical protein
MPRRLIQQVDIINDMLVVRLCQLFEVYGALGCERTTNNMNMSVCTS